MSHVEHEAEAPAQVRCFVLTISDTRTEETDTAGKTILELLESHGHLLVGRRIVRDDLREIRSALLEQIRHPDVQAILVTGGTGISSRDVTYEAVLPLIDKRLDGFGELFRMLSYHEIGPAAMLSRTIAGTAGNTILLVLPGSRAAVTLGMTKLVLPQLGHMVGQATK